MSFWRSSSLKILTILDSSGNPVTETIQSVGVTDASGNPVTGEIIIISELFKENISILVYIIINDH